MDAKIINPFITSITTVLPQLGFKSVNRKSLNLSAKNLKLNGVMLSLSIIGEKKGNIVYNFSEDTAKLIASTLMGGFEVNEFDEIAKSAVSEMSNMLTANSSIGLSNIGINVDISVPTLAYGSNVSVEMSEESVIEIIFDMDGHDFRVYLSID